MKDPLVKGHPLHAMLTDIPIGSAVAGVAFDLLGGVTGDARWRFAARASLSAALAGGAASALVGLWDYQAVPADHPARPTGATHAWLNLAALGALAASVGFRARGDDAPIQPAAALSLAALGLLGASGWLGGHLVYRLGWRVVPAEHAEQLEADLRDHGEQARVERAHAVVREYEQRRALIP
jgi:uncharacterized membrane protein